MRIHAAAAIACVAIWLSAGCSGVSTRDREPQDPPVMLAYPDYSILIVPDKDVKSLCWDQDAACCWRFWEKMIVAGKNAAWCVVHELCHKDYGDFLHQGVCRYMNWWGPEPALPPSDGAQ